MTRLADALIVGGGPAGAALAITLASAGRSVLLLEREAGPHHKVCGEFLSREAVLHLAALDVDLDGLGAVHIDGVRLQSGRNFVEAKLPFEAMSLSRRALDDALLRRAAQCGAEIRMGAKVQELDRETNIWRARLADGTEETGRQAFLATGKHDVRGWGRPASAQTDFIGFKLHWRLTQDEMRALGSHVELSLFRDGYAGLERVEGDTTNLCLVVRKARFAACGQSWETLIDAIRAEASLLDQRLRGGEACWERPLAVYGIPYGYLRRASDDAWFLGDQAAVIPSFSGDGMSIALHSARLAAADYLRGDDCGAYQRRLALDMARPVTVASWVARGVTSPMGRTLIGPVLTALPGAIACIAVGTRVPARALRRLGIVSGDRAPLGTRG